LSILLFLIIIGFVFTIGLPRKSGRQKSTPTISIIKTEQILLRYENSEKCHCSRILKSADIDWITKNLECFVIRRIIALGLADEFEMPNPTPGILKEYIKELPICLDRKGEFSVDLDASLLEIFERNARR
jgi:hypothetical protein